MSILGKKYNLKFRQKMILLIVKMKYDFLQMSMYKCDR